MKKKNRIGTVFIYLIFIVLCLAILYPFLCVLSVSLSSAEDIKLYGFRVLPKHLDFSAYSYLFRDSKMLWQAYGTTIFVSVVGTAIGCLVTSLYAYAISRTTFRWRGVLSLFVTFTMFFSGGMAAQYITYVKLLNLKNSIWVLILPGAFSALRAARKLPAGQLQLSGESQHERSAEPERDGRPDVQSPALRERRERECVLQHGRMPAERDRQQAGQPRNKAIDQCFPNLQTKNLL